MIDDLLNRAQFSLLRDEKRVLITELLKSKHELHYENSIEYKTICDTLFRSPLRLDNIEDFPFIPVSVFKNHTLKSIQDNEVFKVLTSSGTTGQQVSRIYLDKRTSQLQTLALSKIISHIVGVRRLPMLIIDSKKIFENRQSFSARGAGILGLSVFGKDHTYVLDDEFKFDEKAFSGFLEKYSGQPILIFGFTFMVWQFLYQSARENNYNLNNAILIHSGGWKKLIELSVDNATFRKSFNDKYGIEQIYNFYGMVEQVGSVFIENSDGSLQCPNFADVIIRNPQDFSVQPMGKEGLIQVISVLPESYPGHSLLTEDIGIITGEDDANNGWKGKQFKILGRAKKAELRGCSDTFNKN